MSGMLQDKVVIVTGGGSGIGHASAVRFAQEGAQVAIADINLDQAAAVALEITQAGGRARAFAANVTREVDVEALVAATVSAFGRLDGAFNNAGIGSPQQRVADFDETHWQSVLAVNLTGPFLCSKHEIRAMLKTGGGSIVNMASVAGLKGVPLQAAYSASKHGVIGLTRTTAAEYAKRGIRVNAACPGVVETPANRAMGIDWNSVVPTPMGRIAQPEEVAELVMWLLSDRSSYVTGQAYCVDGGMTAATFIPE
jgi:NAD(P)-dependent dehydrogenase (short-subunit alcohol dehydrogenase family)